VCFCGAHRVQQRGVPTALIYIRVWIVTNASSSLA
jgi:hypothetical protein